MKASDWFHFAGIYTLAFTLLVWAWADDIGAWPDAVVVFYGIGAGLICISLILQIARTIVGRRKNGI